MKRLSYLLLATLFVWAASSHTFYDTEKIWQFNVVADGEVSIQRYAKYTDADSLLIIPSQAFEYRDGDSIQYIVVSVGRDNILYGNATRNFVKKCHIPHCVREIRERAFYLKDNLIAVDVPNSLETIEMHAFSSSTRQALEFNVYADTIGYKARYKTPKRVFGCFANRDFSKLVIPDSTRIVSNTTFHNSTIGELVLPDSLDYFEYSIFQDEKSSFWSLEKIIFPENVKSIAAGGVLACDTTLREIVVEGSDTFIGGEFLRLNSKYLEKVTMPEFLPRPSPSRETKGVLSFSDVVDFVIPDNLRIINQSALSYMKWKTITIPASVRKIDVKAFAGSPFLNQVSIPCDVDSIQFGAFQNCASLKSFTIEDGLKPLKIGVFEPVEYCYNVGWDGDEVYGHTASTHTKPLSDIYAYLASVNRVPRNEAFDYEYLSVKGIDENLWCKMNEFTILDSLYIGRNLEWISFDINDPKCIDLFEHNYDEWNGMHFFYHVDGAYPDTECYVFHDSEALFKSQFALKVLSIGPSVTDISFTKGMPILEQLKMINLHSPFPKFDITAVLPLDQSLYSIHVPIGCKPFYLDDYAYAEFTNIIDDLPNPYDVNHDGEVNVGDINTVLTSILDGSCDTHLDANHDGAIDVGDVNMLLKTILMMSYYE